MPATGRVGHPWCPPRYPATGAAASGPGASASTVASWRGGRDPSRSSMKRLGADLFWAEPWAPAACRPCGPSFPHGGGPG
jgi:hypothetical protein